MILNFNIKDICDSGSQLNIFTYLNPDNFNLNGNTFNQIINSINNSNSSYIFLNNSTTTTTSTTTTATTTTATNSSNTTNNNNNNNNLIDFFQSSNNLNNLNSTQCPVQTASTDPLLINSTTQICFCQTLYSFFTQNNFLRIIFDQISPILVGKIPYSPQTPAYKKLIQKVNATFSSIADFGSLLANLSLLANQTVSLLNENESLIKNLSSILNITNISDFESLTVQLRLAAELLRFSANLINCFEANKFIGFNSEQEAVQTGQSLADKGYFLASFIFQNNESANPFQLPNIVNYKIRMPTDRVHNTNKAQDNFYRYGPPNSFFSNSYFLFGFIYLQDMLEKAIIESKTNLSYDMGITAQMTPYPCYVDDRFTTAIARLLPLFMVLSWIYSVSMLVKDIVYEKEKRLKEFMRVMGLTNITHWMAWFLTSFLTMFFVSFILCLIIKYGKITTFSDVTVLIAFYCCFSIATISQCFLISTFFNRANLAAVVGGIIYFLLYLPYTILVTYSDVLQLWLKVLASFSSTVAFGLGFQIIGVYELQNVGATWSNFATPPYSTGNNSLSLFDVCLILLFDAFIYMLLTLYIECVAPGEYGVAKPWYFLFTFKFWLGKYEWFKKLKVKNNFLKAMFINSKEKIILEQEENNNNTKSISDSVEIVNENESNLEAGIEIIKLHKVYSRGNNHALKGLSLKFYKNEITAFLGHNGAGKSTTMHLLTGLYKPTSGTAKMNGLSISDSMDEIRKSLGKSLFK